MERDEFLSELSIAWAELPAEAADRIWGFYQAVLQENEKQNLTRITEAKEFLEANVVDVRELLTSDTVDFPAMDLGSGGGVPGVLAAAVGSGPWILAESENQKAMFLDRTLSALGLADLAQAYSGRAEKFLSSGNEVRSVVARAVGPVERIYGWLRSCSTWNTLVLLKGPRWTEEWDEFKRGRYRNELAVEKTHTYTVGAEKKQRIIVRLKRVPRGTNKPAAE